MDLMKVFATNYLQFAYIVGHQSMKDIMQVNIHAGTK
jgi:hypothetical protein